MQTCESSWTPDADGWYGFWRLAHLLYPTSRLTLEGSPREAFKGFRDCREMERVLRNPFSEYRDNPSSDKYVVDEHRMDMAVLPRRPLDLNAFLPLANRADAIFRNMIFGDLQWNLVAQGSLRRLTLENVGARLGESLSGVASSLQQLTLQKMPLTALPKGIRASNLQSLTLADLPALHSLESLTTWSGPSLKHMMLESLTLDELDFQKLDKAFPEAQIFTVDVEALRCSDTSGKERCKGIAMNQATLCRRHFPPEVCAELSTLTPGASLSQLVTTDLRGLHVLRAYQPGGSLKVRLKESQDERSLAPLDWAASLKELVSLRVEAEIPVTLHGIESKTSTAPTAKPA